MTPEHATPDSIVRLRRTHQRRRTVPLLYAASAMLVAMHMSAAEAHGSWTYGDIMGVAMAAFGVTVLIWWLSRQRRQTLASTARAIDAKLALQSRCEAACELADHDTGIAVALREDVGRRLEGRSLPGTPSWYAACTVLGVAVLLAVIEVALPPAPQPLPPSRTARTNVTAAAANASEKPPPVNTSAQPAPAVSVPAAALQWIAPPVVVEASTAAEVVLSARATTAVPVESARLQIAINGGPAHSVTLDADALARFSTEGEPIEATLYLDEFPLREADVVSYRLSALRRDDPSRPLVSPTQFVVVSNLNEPVGSPADIRRLRELRSQLQAQVALLAEVLNATEETGAATATQWQQHELAQRVQALRDELLPQPAAAPLIDALWQMRRAENHIANRESGAAAERQYGALNGLRTAQRLQLEAMRAIAGAVPKLPPRHETPAGRIEQVAKRQKQIAEKLSEPDPMLEPPDPDASESAREGRLEPDEAAAKRVRAEEPTHAENQDSGDDPVQDRAGGNRGGSAQGGPAGRQASPGTGHQSGDLQPGAGTQAGRTSRPSKNAAGKPDHADLVGQMGQVTRELQELQEGSGGGASTRTLQQAIFDSSTAVERAAQGNLATALEPALAAAMALDEAARQQERAGMTAAHSELESIRRELNDAARAGRGAGELQGIIRRLEAAANAQQKFGAARGAEALMGAANELRGAGGEAPWRQAAATLSKAQAAIGPRGEALAQTARRIGRLRSRLGDPAPERAAESLELAAQLAGALLTRDEDRALARQLADAANAGIQRHEFSTLDALAEQVGQALVAESATAPVDETSRHFDREAVDPAYRAAVEAYFEALARRASADRTPARQP